MATTKKYYWLKLKRDFFKRHDIRIIEEMENGKDYILFYLKLLLESVDHEGELRFSEMIPFDEKMLSIITNTNIDIVRSAVKLFKELHLIEIFDDGTLYLNQVNNMMGYETSDAIRMRKVRAQKILQITDGEQCSQTFENRSPEIEIELEKEIKKEKEKRSRFAPPSLEDLKKYCEERKNNIGPQSFIDFYESKGWMIGKNKMKDWRAAVRTWEKREKRDRPKSPETIDEIRERLTREREK